MKEYYYSTSSMINTFIWINQTLGWRFYIVFFLLIIVGALFVILARKYFK
jgi:hypothetical protein